MLKRLKKYSLILLGNLICAVAIVFFVVPAGFITGGATGVSLALEQFFHLPVQYGIAILSIALLAVGWIFLGKGFAASTALSAISFPSFVWLMKIVAKYVPFSTDNIFLNLAAAAILMGYGVSLVLKNGASTGGMDTIAVILNSKRGVSISLMVNILEILSMATQVYYSTTEQIMGGILMTLLFTAIMNHLLAKGVARVQVMVYSKQYEAIREYVEKSLERGCTLFRVQGGYTREDSMALQIVINNRELFRLKEQIRKIDPVAFITISEVSEVGGRGFSLDKNAPDK